MSVDCFMSQVIFIFNENNKKINVNSYWYNFTVKNNLFTSKNFEMCFGWAKINLFWRQPRRKNHEENWSVGDLDVLPTQTRFVAPSSGQWGGGGEEYDPRRGETNRTMKDLPLHVYPRCHIRFFFWCTLEWTWHVRVFCPQGLPAVLGPVLADDGDGDGGQPLGSGNDTHRNLEEDRSRWTIFIHTGKYILLWSLLRVYVHIVCVW